ncbi:TIR domain-containing protein [[Luteovulum] sphaeroides subsp. megalophilum]|uniref:toll/interleukin-1 receptor domain-containing protein n=1 Tax=Cereibacter sphaeroides TaxID=1063 RepID=UPI000B6744B9|nr:toll/interleukin-1 receptor domain-containing protein [Cereibacter sphaeroides]SNT44475.1 TIR domain-containing protein [[Luteovulum] sphaeroides subsp. megalophilum]
MATVFISYSHADKAYAANIAQRLREHDQIVSFDLELSARDNWRAQLSNKLAQANIFILVLSHTSASASYPMAEVGRALGRAETGDVLILPIAIDDVTIPTILQDRFALRVDGRPLDEYFPEILSAIVAFEGRRHEQSQRFEAVERDLSKFVDDAIKQQRLYESNNKFWALFWQFFGVIALFVVVGVTGFSLYMATSKTVVPADPSVGVFSIVTLVVANVIIIGVMTALARYAYSLSKSYMSESLKSSDRIHASQFGKFFLRVYGGRLTPTEVKDAFQHCNIDRSSTFSTLDPSHIDPQIYALIAQLLGAFSAKKDK